MNKVLNVAKVAQRALSAHSPSILTGIGVAGVFTTAALAVRATPGALRKMEAAELVKIEQSGDENIKLTPVEIVQLTWTDYAPAVLVGVGAAACIIGSNRISSRRSAMAMSLMTISDAAVNELKTKVDDQNGEGTVKKAEDALKEDRRPESVPEPDAMPRQYGNRYMMKDSLTGQYFYSNKNLVDTAVNEVNAGVLRGDEVSQNDFYEKLGMRRVDRGDEFGWKDEQMLDIYYDVEAGPEGMEPVQVIEYREGYGPTKRFWG